jgi:transcription antitermination factor NusG
MCAFRVDRNFAYSQPRRDGPLPISPWFAVFTQPRHEKKVAERLRALDVEAYLPSFQSKHYWKNRQTVQIEVPLFPGYVFGRISPANRKRVLGAPGVVTIVEGARTSGQIPEHYIELLRAGLALGRIRPHNEPVVGDPVRIVSEPFTGVEGVLACERSETRVVVAIESVGQAISIEVSRAEIELVVPLHADANVRRSLYQ